MTDKYLFGGIFLLLVLTLVAMLLVMYTEEQSFRACIKHHPVAECALLRSFR